ncbi:DUF2637 domain-containing protein [Streptomyces umbrinus]
MTAGSSGTPVRLTRTHRILIGVVVAGAVVIAGIGFAGSYAAVRELALQKGFGKFSYVFPIGIDAGICVLLALDLLLTWIRIPFPLLRQTAWLLTAATIAFNGAAAWPDPLGVGMHGVIPILFVVSVEAARHAIGRIADITADKHMEGVRLTRWALSPVPTFLLWRRMKLWELRSYEQVIKLEQERLVYQARLRSRFGRAWRRKAPVESLMPLRLARYGVPLADTAEAGLAAAGIDAPMLFLTTPKPNETPVANAPVTAEHQRALETDPSSRDTAGHEDQAALPAPAPAAEAYVPAPSEPTTQPPLIEYSAESFSGFATAYADYVNRHGDYPNARQFGLFLADGYGISDATTGGPLTEAELRPVVQELRQRAETEEEWMTDPTVMGVTDPDVLTDPTGHAALAGTHAFLGAPSDASLSLPQPPAAQPVPASMTSTADTTAAGGRLPQQTALDLTPTGPITASSSGEATVWEATVTDTGEATARVPEHADTPVSELTEEQRVERVVEWLIEAEVAGKRFSGAEAARRNEVSPKTGQRDVLKAKEILAQRPREKGRGHLRSVRNS